MSSSEIVLELEGVEVADAPCGRIDLVLHAGEITVIEADEARAEALTDTVTGLVEPASGRVRFLGRDWSAMRPDIANAMRGRIGSCLATASWLGHLGVADNVILPQAYHTRRSRARLLSEAARLATKLGLPGLPTDPAAGLPAQDLQRAALARALMGEPALLLLEEPFRHLHPGLQRRAMGVLQAARARGAAILWLQTDIDAVPDLAFVPEAPWHLDERGLRPMGDAR